MAIHWSASEALGRLRDAVASDRLVLFTGAGISLMLPRASDPTRRLPSWPELLLELAARFHAHSTDQDRADLSELLDDRAEARHLIGAAGILRAVDPAEFDRLVVDLTTPVDGATTTTHTLLLNLEPRGVITLNYDSGHEAAFRSRGLGFTKLTQESEKEFAEWLRMPEQEPFLLKAHGTGEAGPLVLGSDSYREAIHKRPAYRGFLQYVLSHYHLLFVGFGLDDPDFAAFTDAFAATFNSPVHDHIVIRRPADYSREFILRRRGLGLHALFLDDYGELPKLLEAATGAAGPRLMASIESALHPEMASRRKAHAELARLGAAGRKVASNELTARVAEAESRGNWFQLSEIAYSLGLLDARANKPVLLELIGRTTSADVLGRALTVLRPAFEPGDLPALERLRERALSGLEGSAPERIVKYVDYLLVYVPSKFASDPPAVTASP